mmetsp:Transcript_146835/g.258786  ORF Transcript_146835/g.258786 Transcript_146835/m.258786 type:complete len:211 (-) Transcript_146835:45-677(-)
MGCTNSLAKKVDAGQPHLLGRSQGVVQVKGPNGNLQNHQPEPPEFVNIAAIQGEEVDFLFEICDDSETEGDDKMGRQGAQQEEGDPAKTCPKCSQRGPVLCDVSMGATHESWGRSWKTCKYDCARCGKPIEAGISVNACRSCKCFWHKSCRNSNGSLCSEAAVVQLLGSPDVREKAPAGYAARTEHDDAAHSVMIEDRVAPRKSCWMCGY